jgi:hypothetical protein
VAPETKETREVYFSLDIETDGQVPGLNSMRSIGMVAFTAEHIPIGEFHSNLRPWPGAKADVATMEWWLGTDEKRAMWQSINSRNLRDPEDAMYDCLSFIDVQIEKTGFRPVCVCSPTGFDYSFFRWYAYATQKQDSPFGHRCLDIRSYVMGLFGRPYLQSGNETLPPEILTELPITHDALDDARKQAHIFFNLLQFSKKLNQIGGGAACQQLSGSLTG